MKRVLLSTAAIVLTIATVPPSFAALISCDATQERNDNGMLVSTITANARRIAQELRSRGINATRVEDWNGCIRAYVAGADGSERMQYFEPDTYRRLQ
ncbi:MAG TPA: hypothetical protein VGO70_05375 [Arsenicitalea sp.]|jgi:hypothetical protein|nr:hypothetical protein [Arsenicitalea sp.]